MKIHEYQAKEIFARHGMPVPPGEVVTTAEDAKAVAERIGKPVMVKAQVHVGGRGKAGGVKYCENADVAYEHASNILGMDIKGLTVKKVLITEAVDITSECYVGIIIDRTAKKPVFMVSPAGGIDIEQVAAETPEKIFKKHINPLRGITVYEARWLAYKLYSDPSLVKQATKIIMQLYDAYFAVDASLAEINPLITTGDGRVLAIDAKINIDDNGLYRHPEIEELRDMDAEDQSEMDARDAGLSFVKLDGNIGCIVNGAGLAMATMDLVKYFGGEPANFLDIGGSSNPEKVVRAMEIILRDSNVKAILFNIVGGITRCDDVANGIVEAINRMQPQVPIVIRLTGTNEAEARKILESVNLAAATTMDEVVKKAIDVAGV